MSGPQPLVQGDGKSAVAAPDTKTGLLATAFAMVGAMPLADLTLRPLADRAGVSVATLNHHFGNKQAVLTALVSASIAREAEFVGRWNQSLGRLAITDRAASALMANAVFEDWVAANRLPLLVLLDLLRSPELVDDGERALRSWSVDMGGFWSMVLFGEPGHGTLALGYVIDEAAFALGSPDAPLYRALRRLCLETLVAHVADGRSASRSNQALFNSLVNTLEPQATPPGLDNLGKRARAIVHCAADMLSSPSYVAITHRSVAEAAGVSPATVVYQFGPTEDLIVAGLYAMIDRFRRGAAGLGPASPTPLADLVRATGVMALASARMPVLAPHAIDMRRRRGENVTADALAEGGVPRALAEDAIFRQIFSVALFGSRRLAYALDGPPDEQAAEPVLAFLQRRAAGA